MTSGFVAAADAHRKLLKLPDLPYFVVPHPIISMSDEDLRASADAIFEKLFNSFDRLEAKKL